MEVGRAIDFFEHPYYKLNKMFMKLNGQWPYQSECVRFVILTVVFLTALTNIPPIIIAVVRNLDDFDILMEGILALLFSGFCVVKQITFILMTQKMLMLLNHIRTDWEVWAQDRDVDILHVYAKKGRTVTIVYSFMSYVTCTLYLMQPIIPKIVDTLLRNGTAPGQFSMPVDYYYIDMQQYYFYIVLHCYLAGFLGFMTSMTYDVMFLVTVQHGCGLFAAVGRKLQRIGKYEGLAKTEDIVRALKNPEVTLKDLVWCIERHQDAIEYAEFIEATYSWCFFIVMGINMLLISISGLQIVKITVDLTKTIRFIFGNILCLWHLLIDNYMAQHLMDHSSSIHYSIVDGEWYELPVKIQKILLFIMMRCNVPCKLTAGKVSILSIETFGVILKTSLSYFTLLRSF